MTRKHGGYQDAELDALVGTAPRPDSEAGRAAFLGEMNNPPDINAPIDGAPAPVDGQPEDVRSLKTEAMARKFSGKMNKFKKALADKVPKVLSSAIKDKGPEWQLTQDDSELLAEACENCLEVLEIDFQIKPIATVLSNPLWVLLLPVFVLILIFVPKAAANSEQIREYLKKKAEEKQPDATETVSAPTVQ